MKKKIERYIASERERRQKRMDSTLRAEVRKQKLHDRGARRVAGKRA